MVQGQQGVSAHGKLRELWLDGWRQLGVAQQSEA